jgi:hypothetical protein
LTGHQTGVGKYKKLRWGSYIRSDNMEVWLGTVKLNGVKLDLRETGCELDFTALGSCPMADSKCLIKT